MSDGEVKIETSTPPAAGTPPAVQKRRGGRPKRVPAAEKQRKRAPGIEVVEELYVDGIKSLVNRTRSAMGELAVGKDFVLGPSPERWARESETWTSQGYEPVLLPDKTGASKLQSFKGCPLLMIDAKTAEARRAAPGREAREQLQDTLAGENEKYSTRDADGNMHAPFRAKE